MDLSTTNIKKLFEKQVMQLTRKSFRREELFDCLKSIKNNSLRNTFLTPENFMKFSRFQLSGGWLR
ncbi:hypothetical protein GOV03_04010 [Candidatus Woesearchaeota archaeon]|nr:hypothetical protein [Candidatus Woesearchaeota archaeon]